MMHVIYYVCLCFSAVSAQHTGTLVNATRSTPSASTSGNSSFPGWAIAVIVAGLSLLLLLLTGIVLSHRETQRKKAAKKAERHLRDGLPPQTLATLDSGRDSPVVRVAPLQELAIVTEPSTTNSDDEIENVFSSKDPISDVDSIGTFSLDEVSASGQEQLRQYERFRRGDFDEDYDELVLQSDDLESGAV